MLRFHHVSESKEILINKSEHVYCYLAAIGVFVIALLVWSPAIFTPWWGDDYFFLQNAKEFRLQNVSWLKAFYSESNTAFWRPLSMDLPWRLIEKYFSGNPVSAHLLSAAFWFLSVLSVANLGFQLAKAMKWNGAIWLSLLTSIIYGFHGIHILVLHWVSAINSAILVFFVAATLAAWIAAQESTGVKSLFAACITVLCLVLAFFSKEVAILLPAMMLALTVFLYGFRFPRKMVLILWVSCLIICFTWLYFFKQFTPIRYSAYEIELGAHVAKNALALLAWLLNVPREAVRLYLSGNVVLSVLWVSACLLPLSISLWMVSAGIKRTLTLLQWASVIAFCVFSYAPYFLLQEQSYEYYASIALIFPSILFAKGLTAIKPMPLALLLFATSSSASIIGNRLLDYPSLLGRAAWAEQQFEYVLNNTDAHLLAGPIYVKVENYHQFSAIEISGLAWRLDLPRHKIVLVDGCQPLIKQLLVQDRNGNFNWKECINEY